MSSSTHLNHVASTGHSGLSLSWMPIVTGLVLVPILLLVGLILSPQNTLFVVKSIPSNDVRLKRSASTTSTTGRSRSTTRRAGFGSELSRSRSKSAKRASCTSGTVGADAFIPTSADPLPPRHAVVADGLPTAAVKKRSSSKKPRQRRATLSGSLPSLDPHQQGLPFPSHQAFTSATNLPPIPPLPFSSSLSPEVETPPISGRNKSDLRIVAPPPQLSATSPNVPLLSPKPCTPLQRPNISLTPRRATPSTGGPLHIDSRVRSRPKSWHSTAVLPPPTPSTPVPSLPSTPPTPTRSLSPTTSVMSGISPNTWSGYATDPPLIAIDRVYQQLLDAQAHLRTLMDHCGATSTWWAPRFSVIAPLHARARRVMYLARDMLPTIPAWARPRTPMGSSRASSMMAAHESGSPRDSPVPKGAHNSGEAAGGEDLHDPVVVLVLASTHEAQRIEVIHARARARARAQDKAADALAAVLEVVYPPGDFSEAVVVLRQYACSVEDRLRVKPPTGDEAKTVIMFVLVHVCMLAEIGVAFTEGFTLEHLLVKDSARPLSMTNLVLSGYQNMQTVNGAVSVVDAAADHAAGLPMQLPTQLALTRLFRRVEHFSDDLPLPIELDPEVDFNTLQSLYAAIARNDG